MISELALCNEVLRTIDFVGQCRTAANLGYDALEVAPFTLGEQPHLLSAARRKELRKTAEDCGLRISGLHWLLVTPPGLSINCADAAVRQKTVQVLKGLIELCVDLGGNTLVHGSPQQRSVERPEDYQQAWSFARDTFGELAEAAESAGVNYCIEPLSRAETNFINTIRKAVKMAEEIGSRAICTMLDARAARSEEETSLANLLDKWVPSGWIRHIHLNDRNRRGPGQGEDEFSSVLLALRRNGYSGTVSVEPFDYCPDGASAAAAAVGYLKGLQEALRLVDA